MPNPVISVVSGTYNRRDYLQKMMLSAELAMPAGVSYEFVIVDGGSTDGTLDFLRGRPNTTVIEHGELRGAIPAFCDGARASLGDYVVLANDDITFGPFSIAAALAYLEDHPRCGGVAFADNRPTRFKSNQQYATEGMPAIMPDGAQTFVTYAQVGMFRAWLGHKVGWWGDSDDVMKAARTYGGDNFLSARIWEEGYTVDPVPGVQVTDHIVPDVLRETNTRQNQPGMHPDSAAFRRRFPNGPQMAAEPSTPNPQQRRLRMLYLPIYEAGHPLQHRTKRGLRLALKKYGHVYEIDYLNSGIDLANAVKAWQPDLLISQFQDASNVTPDRLAYLRQLCPHMRVINWHGDARGLEEPIYLDLLRYVDLQLVVNAAPLELYRERGITAAYWQIGYEKPQTRSLPDVPEYDIVYLANAYMESRHELGRFLRSLPYTVGLYGAGWPDGDGECLYDFATACAIHRNAKLVVGDAFPGTLGFVSNRFIQTLGDGGGMLLHQAVPELEQWTGFVDGKHYVAWDDLDDLREKIDHWLAREKGRAAHRGRIRKAGRVKVEKEYTFKALVRQLFVELLPLMEKGAVHEPA